MHHQNSEHMVSWRLLARTTVVDTWLEYLQELLATGTHKELGLQGQPPAGATMVARAHTEQRDRQRVDEEGLGKKRNQRIRCWLQLLLQKKNIRSDGKYLLLTRPAAFGVYFQLQKPMSESERESKGVGTSWICAGYGVYFCILVIAFTFLCARLLSLQDCDLSPVPAHLPASHGRGRCTWVIAFGYRELCPSPLENAQLQSTAASDRENLI